MLTQILEIGRKVSKANEARLRKAVDAIQEILAGLAEDVKEAASQTLSYDDIRKALQAATSDNLKLEDWYCYIADVFPDWYVYVMRGKYYRADYTVDADNKVTVGEPAEVTAQVVYTPAEAQLSEASIETDFAPVTEFREGRAYLKLIAPGWGSSGYYPAEVLKRDGPTIYTAGLKNYWNHDTPAEEAARPEGDLSRLASELEENATYREDAADGPGLYAWAKTFAQYSPTIADMKRNIGVSVRGVGLARVGEREGRTGPIFERLLRAKSADYVTVPGAGGKIVEMFEAAASRITKGESHDMTEAQIRELSEAKAAAETANAGLRRLETQLLRMEASEAANQQLAEVRNPALVARVIGEATREIPVKDGVLDRVAFATKVTEALKSEQEYAAAIGGGIREAGPSRGASTFDPAKAEEELQSVFAGLGMDSNTAALAAKGRA